LRRATSDIYFALFHKVCETLVAAIGQDADNAAFRETYITLYRLPEHGLLEKRCKEALGQGFSIEVKKFAQHLITMKNKRHQADYDPLEKFAISDVENDLSLARSALTGFDKVVAAERARFAYFASLDGKKLRTNN
jgi:hypothetical protein